EVDDGADAEFGEAREHAVEPRPVEAPRLGLDAVPRHTPTHESRPGIRGEREVVVPADVVLGERVLIDRALAGPLLRHEGVFDADAEVQGAVAVPGRRHLSPVVAMLSMKRRCTSRKAMASGTTAMSEPAIMTP